MCEMCDGTRRIYCKDIPIHEHVDTYREWRKPFSPKKERIVFIGLAPPVPTITRTHDGNERFEFRYIYNKPDSEFIKGTTAIRLKNALKEAMDYFITWTELFNTLRTMPDEPVYVFIPPE